MHDAIAAMWKGGTTAASEPHRCPLRPDGADKKTCIEHGGASVHNNANCCGTQRNSVNFEACNSRWRRCKKCIEVGRRGLKANAVKDPVLGLCEEHLQPEVEQPRAFRLSATPRLGVVRIDSSASPNRGARDSILRAPPVPDVPARTAPALQQSAKPAVHILPPVETKRSSIENLVTPVAVQQVFPPLPAQKTQELLPDTAQSDAETFDVEVLPPMREVTVAENSPWRTLIERAQRAIERGEPMDIPAEQIRPMPNQPRKFFSEEGILRLANSFRLVGQIVRGFVRRVRDGKGSVLFELIDGERRWRAAKLAGLPYKAIVIEVDDASAAFIVAAVANFNRADHTPTEISDSIEVMRVAGVSMEEIADMIGVSLHWSYQLHGLQKLHAEVREMLDPDLPKSKRLPISAAIDISKAEEYLQLGLAHKVLRREVSLQSLRKQVVRESLEHGARVRTRMVEPARKWDSIERQSHLLSRHSTDLKEAFEDQENLRTFLRDRNPGRVLLVSGSLKNAREQIAAIEKLIREAS